MASGTEVGRVERLGRSGIARPQSKLLKRDAVRLARTAAADAETKPEERPLWQLVAMLYGSIAFLVVFVIAIAFAVAKLVTGAAY
jgi:type IV secretory pathway VirB2 component (pilin)